MKPINEMSLQECLEALRNTDEGYRHTKSAIIAIANRIHELTRWIPVSERLPTKEDVDEYGEVLAYSPDPTITVSASCIPMSHHFTHWRRIDKPEGV